MTYKEFEKRHPDKGMLESLQTSLEQAIEVKKQNDETIAHIRKSLTERIEEMQQAKAMVDGVMGMLPIDGGMPPTPSSVAVRDQPPGDYLRSVQDFFWQWIIPAVVMIVILWIVMWALQNATKEDKARWEIPSLIENVHACALLDRVQERRLNGAEALSEEPKNDSDIADDSTGATLFSDESPEVVKESSSEEMSTFSNRRPARRHFLRNLFKLP